ncbi:methyl-accepting chemotaxis protein [Domibacillus indicus]|uniref:methyl-accepting chemotaxis protein n=1 Tax=Domibacillus indicus TaxID=1437523 RepID=UPI000697DAA1|nr:HAMP domain-containing methyl-accepting chemotaxis protein [Domibacillus indicus]
MKISLFLKIMTAISVILILLIGGSVLYLFKNIEEQSETLQISKESLELTMQFQRATEYLTNEVRSYAQSGSSTHYENYWNEVNETQTRENVIASMDQLHIPEELLTMVHNAKETSDWLVSMDEEAMQSVESGDLNKARSVVFGTDYEFARETISEPLQEFSTGLDDWTRSIVEDRKQKVLVSFSIMTGAVVLLFAAVFFMIMMLFAKIKPLAKLTRLAEEISKGQLDVPPLKLKSKDEVAILAASFNDMAANLRGMVSTIHKVSENLAASSRQLIVSEGETKLTSKEVGASIEEISEGANQQLNQVVESAAAIKEVSNGVGVIVNTAMAVAESSEETTRKSKMGEENIRQAVRQMKKIEEQVGQTAGSIRTLGDRSQEIEKIIDAITDISTQTNLLALNAAIEAARAGEHGRGFAVVADEVRKLAEESNQSANRITKLIQSIQNDTLSAVQQMTSVTEEVQNGVKIIENTGSSFQEILNSAELAAGQIQEVSAVLNEISLKTDGMSRSFESVSESIQNGAHKTNEVVVLSERQYEAVEEISAAAENLQSLAEELKEQINRFDI